MSLGSRLLLRLRDVGRRDFVVESGWLRMLGNWLRVLRKMMMDRMRHLMLDPVVVMMFKMLNVGVERFGRKWRTIVHPMVVHVMSRMRWQRWMAHMMVVTLTWNAVMVIHICHGSLQYLRFPLVSNGRLPRRWNTIRNGPFPGCNTFPCSLCEAWCFCWKQIQTVEIDPRSGQTSVAIFYRAIRAVVGDRFEALR